MQQSDNQYIDYQIKKLRCSFHLYRLNLIVVIVPWIMTENNKKTADRVSYESAYLA